MQQGSPITSIDQLAGKTIGVCGACTYESYLNRNLDIPGYTPTYVVPENITLKTYDTDSTAIQDLALGRLDAAMSAVPTLQGAIDKGKPIQLLGRSGVLRAARRGRRQERAARRHHARRRRSAEIIDAMHADGTLTELSQKWYGEDLTVNPVG